MAAKEKTAADESWALDNPARSREELIRRLDEIWAGQDEFDVESTQEWKELIASQEEFRARIEERLRRIAGR